MFHWIVGAGHGQDIAGRGDPGAVDPEDPASGDYIHTEEDEVNLWLALHAGWYYENRWDGGKAHYTRTTDENVSLQTKINRANDIYRDTPAGERELFVGSEIHANSGGGKGIEVLYLGGKDIAQAQYDELKFVSPHGDRGLKYRTDLGWLNQTSFLATIPEVGFIDNVDEEKLLNDFYYREALALALAAGVAKYQGLSLAKPTHPLWSISSSPLKTSQKDEALRLLGTMNPNIRVDAERVR